MYNKKIMFFFFGIKDGFIIEKGRNRTYIPDCQNQKLSHLIHKVNKRDGHNTSQEL